MSSLEEKKNLVPSEIWIQVLTSVEDLISRGYLDPSRKNVALEKFLDDYIQKTK